MKVAVLAAFVREPREILLVADRTNAKFNEIPSIDWTFTALISGSEEDFEKAAAIAAGRARIGAVYYPDEETLWRDALRQVPDDVDVIVTLDGATDWPEEIPWLLEPLKNPAVGLAVGVRRKPPTVPDGVEGTLLQIATAGSVADVSSGFRAFRAMAVRGLRAEGSPDEVRAAWTASVVDEGFGVVEVDVTTSAPAPPLPPKLGTTLLKRRLLSRGSLWALLMVLAGLLVLGVSAFPVHQYLADSDAVLTGMCADDVLHGRHYLFFPSGFRIGSLTCYGDAIFVAVMGRTREALAAAGVLWALITLTFVYRALRVAFGRSAALTGMVAAAFPPLQYIVITEWTYGEVMATTAVVWWLGFLLLFRRAAVTKWTVLLYGFALGTAFWVSPQSLMLTGPLTAMLAWRRAIREWLDWVLVACGATAGLWAYFVTVLSKGTEPFTSSFATKPVDSLAQLYSNFHYLFAAVFPTFFFDTEWPLQTPLQGCLFLLLLGALGGVVALAVRWFRGKASDERNGVVAVFTLALLVAVCVLFTISSAGNFRGWTPRYVAPVYFAVPLAVANLYSALRRHSHGIAVLACAIAMAAVHLGTYRYGNDPVRRSQTVALEENHQIHAWMKARNRNVVVGDYWLVYKWNFGFGEGIDSIPVPVMFDYAQLYRRLPAGRGVQMALADLNRETLQRWADRTGLPGHIESAPGRVFVFVLHEPVDPSRVEQIAAQFPQ